MMNKQLEPVDAQRRRWLLRGGLPEGRVASPAGSAGADLRARVSPGCLAHQRVECRVCGECCEASAIRLKPQLGGVALPLLDDEACNGCGACLMACPVGALRLIVVEHASVKG